MRSKHKTPSQFSHHVTELATLLGIFNKKSGVTLGLDHLYSLSLFDLGVLYLVLRIVLALILHPDLGHLLGK